MKNKSGKPGSSSIDFANPNRSAIPSQYKNSSPTPTYNANFSKG